jgi:hypothetical protein
MYAVWSALSVPPSSLVYGRRCRYLVVDSRNVVDYVTFLIEIISNLLAIADECGRRTRGNLRGSRVRFYDDYGDSFVSCFFGM